MNDVARARLGDFIKAYGTAVCNTPTMCQIMLNQYCGAENQPIARRPLVVGDHPSGASSRDPGADRAAR